VETVAFFPWFGVNVDTPRGNPLDNLALRHGWKMRMKKSIQPDSRMPLSHLPLLGMDHCLRVA
jgi:hypothetical protein